MKKILFTSAIVFIFSLIAFADFKPEEKPIRGLNLDTAYTLPPGGFDIRLALPDISLPISFGVFDGLQITTRSIIWLTQVRVPNLSLKWNLAKETDNMPAFSIGGSGNWITVRNLVLNDVSEPYHTIDKIEVFYYNLSGYVSKNFGHLTASASFTYNRANFMIFDEGSDSETMFNYVYDFLKYYTGVPEPNTMFMASFVLHYEILQNLRLVAEGMVTLDEPYAYYLAGGLIWALGDNFRIDAGIIGIRAAQFQTPLPHFGLSLNF